MITRTEVIMQVMQYLHNTHETQADFARTLDISPQALNNWLSGRRLPEYSTYEKLVTFLESNTNDNTQNSC